MKNKVDYSKYECPYSHLEKESGHELHGPEGYQDVYSVWCACGFRAPVFYLNPDELGLKLKKKTDVATCAITLHSYVWLRNTKQHSINLVITFNTRKYVRITTKPAIKYSCC